MMSEICFESQYENQERISILMESCGYTEPEAIAAAQRQSRESESRRMIQEYGR